MPPPDDITTPAAEAAFIRAYHARFAAYHHAWSVFFVTHMGDLRRQFGDLDEALLLAAIGLGPVGDKRRAAERRRDSAGLVFAAAPHGGAPTNAKRLAEMTGIPRETVRRKLERFHARGWIERTERGEWRIAVDPAGSAPLVADMRASHEAFLACLARLMADFARIASGEASAASDRQQPGP